VLGQDNGSSGSGVHWQLHNGWFLYSWKYMYVVHNIISIGTLTHTYMYMYMYMYLCQGGISWPPFSCYPCSVIVTYGIPKVLAAVYRISLAPLEDQPA
jgi:hypothetical protein